MKKRIGTTIFRVFASAIGLFILTATSCSTENVPPAESAAYHNFNSYSDFKSTLLAIATIENEIDRSTQQDTFWDSLVQNQQVPFIMNDSVALMYKKEGSTTKWAGDFNGWNPSWKGTQVGLSDINIYETTLPSDARLDYKIVDNDRWILDPNNKLIQHSGFGPNSELRMPEYEYPTETLVNESIVKGDFSDNTSIYSSKLGYNVQYKVYTPSNYDDEDDLPVIYVTDGHEYADEKLGSMITVLDNLISEGAIRPIISVFIDPRNPDNISQNRRAEEYTANPLFADFVADELVSLIDSQYKTSVNADERAIIGTSLGGWNSGFFGLVRSDKFHLVAIHSPAFNNKIIDDYKNSEKLPIKIFMSAGVINDTETRARSMKAVLEDKGYSLLYKEVNQGHSWGNWRGLLKQPLEHFFPPID